MGMRRWHSKLSKTALRVFRKQQQWSAQRRICIEQNWRSGLGIVSWRKRRSQPRSLELTDEDEATLADEFAHVTELVKQE